MLGFVLAVINSASALQAAVHVSVAWMHVGVEVLVH